MLKRLLREKFNIETLGRYILLIGILLVAFVMVPKDGIDTDTLNSNATYHTLSMVKNMQDYSIDEHSLLPLVSMKNGEPNKWGECLKGNDGKYYYCSFMPLDVIIPYLYFEITGFCICPTHLYMLSFALCILCVFILTLLVFNIFNVEKKNKQIVGLVVGLAYVFSYEGIQCATNVFWGQLLFQPVMLGTIFFLLRRRRSSIDAILVCLGTGIGCLLDWSGYVLAFAVALLILVRFFEEKGIESLKLLIGVCASVFVAVIILLVHYSCKIQIGDYFQYCINRFFSRSIGTNQWNINMADLLYGYWNSYGIWLVFAFASIFSLSIYYYRRKIFIKELFEAIFLIFFTCIENVLMLEHAYEYTYDRIKFSPIIAICVIAVFQILQEKEEYYKYVILTIVCVTSAYCYRGYIGGMHGYITLNQDYSDNYVLADALKNDIVHDDYSSTIVGLNAYCSVRGYTNLLFDCNIIESITLERLKEYAKENRYVQYVYILSDYHYSDKYHIKGFLVGDTSSDEMEYYYVSEGDKVCHSTIFVDDITAMPISDRAFTAGVNLDGSTIRFGNNSNITEKMQNARYLTTTTGEKFPIESVTVYEDCMDVKLLGDYSKWHMEKFEFPKRIEVE